MSYSLRDYNKSGKYGILFCGYNSEQYVEKSLRNFIGRDNFIISAVSVPFLEYREQNIQEDSTTKILQEYLDKRLIHNLVKFPKYIKEHEARNLALKYLKQQKVDYVFLVDADEDYQKEEIDKICEFVEKDSENLWWRICLKNFVFDKETYLEEPFSPPRIFKVNSEEYSLSEMVWDNDFAFIKKSTGELINYLYVKNSIVPQDLVWVDHFTWMSDETSKRKVAYQQSHFGAGICSYKWDYEKDCLTFNEDYFILRDIERPKTKKL